MGLHMLWGGRKEADTLLESDREVWPCRFVDPGLAERRQA